MNAALQAVASSEAFVGYLTNCGPSASELASADAGEEASVATRLLTASRHLFSTMWSGRFRAVKPAEVLACMSKLQTDFQGYGQQVGSPFQVCFFS